MANASAPADFSHVPSSYTDLSPVALGAFGLVVKASVVPGSVRPNNDYFKRLEVNQVAIKRISAKTAFQDCYHAKQVYREITLLKLLMHDNIIKLVDLFLSPDSDVYIVTEAMDCDLGLMINSKPGSFALQEIHVKWIMYQLIRGLRYLHSAGVLHRDLKPQNILVNSQLSIRICDLGLARTNQQQDGLATGYVTTRWYRAPEVMLTWQHYTNALDMWSAGCLFAEMLNRINNFVTYTDGRGANYYALFPSDSHDEHLRLIITRVGVPPPDVMSTIGQPAIQLFVQSTADEVRKQESRPLHEQLGIKDEGAAGLLRGLLEWDPRRRLSAELALNSAYIRQYRAYDGPNDTRDLISTHFEDLELPVHMWQQVIEAEVNTLTLGIARDLSAETFDVLGGASADGSVPDLTTPTPMMYPTDQQDASSADIGSLLLPDIDGREMGYNTSMAINNYETEVDHLQTMMKDPAMSMQERGMVMNAYGEVNSRLEMMRARELEGNDFVGEALAPLP
eukprot:m.146069 g.146069  ORF g.146069 m.146069 type:complete len:508 (+) comp14962_c0_seq12:391-1914(+)